MKQNLLLIDDDSDSILTLSRALSLKLNAVNVHAANNASKAIELAQHYNPQVVICDLNLEPARGIESGFAMLTSLVERDATVRVIMLTGHSDKANGIRALELGASSFLAKPADIEHLVALCRDAFNQAELRRELQSLQSAKAEHALANLVGESTATAELKNSILYAASNNQPVLICGETGTGKGLCALLIHKLSKRKDKKFVRYQPSFTSAEMVNSDLFGHIKGAFTGAESDRQGLILEADGGTLFLDEIDELPLPTQVNLLGTFQDRVFRPLGSNQDKQSDFRLISAGNKPFEQSLQSGALREDFYHRIAHIKIHIPALRERSDDIPLLANSFLQKLVEQEQLSVFEIAPEALQLLQAYNWPGNVRELQAKTESAAYRAAFEQRTTITRSDFALQIKDSYPARINSSTSMNYNENVKAYKQALAEDALAKSDGNQMQAARLLGINRSTLKRVLAGVE